MEAGMQSKCWDLSLGKLGPLLHWVQARGCVSLARQVPVTFLVAGMGWMMVSSLPWCWGYMCQCSLIQTSQHLWSSDGSRGAPTQTGVVPGRYGLLGIGYRGLLRKGKGCFMAISVMWQWQWLWLCWLWAQAVSQQSPQSRSAASSELRDMG